jgi:hypothetical protein
VKFFYSNAEKSFEVEVHMPRKDDTHFNEFAFKNSLEATIDKEKIENLYEKGVIGFLATEENLEDEEFVGYVKELVVQFSDIKFKAFIFNSKLEELVKEKFHIEVIRLRTIYDIAKNVEIYLSNNDRNIFDTKILLTLWDFASDVWARGLNLDCQESVKEFEINNFSYFTKFFDNLEILGYLKQDIEKYGGTFHEMYFKKASQKYGVDIGFDLNETVSKAYVYWDLKLGLQDHQFLKDTLEFNRKYASLQ